MAIDRRLGLWLGGQSNNAEVHIPLCLLDISPNTQLQRPFTQTIFVFRNRSQILIDERSQWGSNGKLEPARTHNRSIPASLQLVEMPVLPFHETDEVIPVRLL